MTSTSVGWVLLDGQGPDAATLDHDAFDVQSGGDAAVNDTSPHAAAARGAQAIAAASGHKVGAVHVTWTADVESAGTALLKSLSELGFDNVVAVTLNQASQAWGIEAGRENEQHKTALCVLEPDTATVMVIATGAGTVRTAVIDNRETTEDLVERLRTVFRKDGWLPESVHLVGSRVDLDEIAEPISDALPIPVHDSVDTQLALARGAALATVEQAETGSTRPAATPQDQPWRVEAEKPAAPPPAPIEPLITAPVTKVESSSPQVVEKRKEPQNRERPWVATHAKKLTISAAAVAAFGAALSLAAGSALNVENVSAQAANPPAGGASVTTPSVRPIPAPVSAPTAAPVQPLAAEPPPPPPAPPAPLAPPAEPMVTVAPEPVSVPVPQRTVSTPPPAAPLVAHAPAAAPAPVAPPPAAPVAAPLPAEVPAPAVAPAPAAAPALVAPPPAAPGAAPPAPLAPPPPAPAPAGPPPPPDPLQQVLSPLFGGLP